MEKLKELGFKEYEAKIFNVLLKGIPMSATEIAKDAKLNRNSIYDTLRSFAERGYCNEIETNTINKYQLIDPMAILDKIEKDYNQAYKNRIAVLKDTFTEINKSYKENKNKSPEDKDSVELIRGFNKQRLAKYLELIKSAKNEILGMTSLKGLITDEVDEATKKFIKSGGVVKSIYKQSLDFKVLRNGSPSKALKEDLINICRNFEKFGEKVRLTKDEIPNMIIIDREKVYVNITGDSKINKNKQSDLIVNDKAFTKNMIDLFEKYWAEAFKLESLTVGNSLRKINSKNI